MVLKRKSLELDMEHEEAAMALYIKRLAVETATVGLMNRVSHFRLGQAELGQLAIIYSRPHVTNGSVNLQLFKLF